MSRLEVRLLGETDVRRDGQLLVFPTKKVKELFAYLVTYHDRAHSRASLIELLWSEHDEAKAKANFRKALSLLRSLLGPEPWLKTAGNDVRFEATAGSCWIDLEEFEQLLTSIEINLS